MQFRVPQFIDIEDKILGPLGWKQLAYIVAGLGLTYIIFKVSSSKILSIFLAIPVISLFGSLAFIRINNKDFLGIVEDATKYFFSNKIYTWQQDSNRDTTVLGSDLDSKTQIIAPFKSSTSSLNSKAFEIDVKNVKDN